MIEREQFFHETAHNDLCGLSWVKGSGFLGDTAVEFFHKCYLVLSTLGRSTAAINAITYFRVKHPYTQKVAQEFPVNYQAHSGNVAFKLKPDTAVVLSSIQVTVFNRANNEVLEKYRSILSEPESPPHGCLHSCTSEAAVSIIDVVISAELSHMVQRQSPEVQYWS